MSVLTGIRVLDFGRFIAGPYCGALLGDLGAEVIRIEKVDGSEDRFTSPIGNNLPGSGFLQLNRNKLGMTLNPRKPEGQQITKRLIATADIIIANLPPSTLASMNLDYESVRSVKEDIILTTSTAFGSSGPFGDRVGFDGVAQAMSSNMHMTGYTTEPMKNYYPYVDFQTATLNALSTVVALMHRQQTGQGQHVQGALLASALTIANGSLIEQQYLNVNREATGNRGQTTAPSDAFPTQDGWILVQVVGNPLYQRWADLMGESYWRTNEKFATDESRGIHSIEISQRMREWTQQRTTDEAVAALDAARIPCGEVLNTQQALDHEQAKSMGFLKPIDYPGLDSPAQIARMPMDFSSIDNSIRRRAPTLGEHTDQLLTELGYSIDDIVSLRESRVV